MAIFKKTTNIEFQQYGEIFTETTFRNEYDENRVYLTVKDKETDYMYKTTTDLFFRFKEGIAVIAITEDLNVPPQKFVIHRICRINKGLYYRFLSISDESLLEIAGNYGGKKYKLNEIVKVNSLESTIHVKEILGDYYLVRAPKYVFPGEIHQFWELTYVDDGTLLTSIEDEEYVVKAQELIFYAPGQKHDQRTENACSYLTVIFDMDISEEEAKKLKNKVLKMGQKEADILMLFSKVGNRENEYLGDILTSLVQTFVVTILAHMNENTVNQPMNTKMQQKYDNELLDEIALYIQENIYFDINVEDICVHFSLSRSSLQTLFAKNLNVSPKQYISDLKFAKAKYMIKESAYSISEIARICGFSSIHYFSRVFKEKYGVTPTSYAKSIGE